MRSRIGVSGGAGSVRSGRRASRGAAPADDHRPIDGLQHVVERQRGGGDGDERFHLDAGAADRARPRADRVAARPRARDRRRRARAAADDRAESISAVRFAAMMPASRAVCSGSPFLTAAAESREAPPRSSGRAPRPRASRSVSGFAPTRRPSGRGPRASTCDSAGARGLARPGHRARLAPGRTTGFRATPSGRRSSASRRAAPCSAPGEKFRIARTPHCTAMFDHGLRRVGRHGDDRDVDLAGFAPAAELRQVVDRGRPARDSAADLRRAPCRRARRSRSLPAGSPDSRRARDRDCRRRESPTRTGRSSPRIVRRCVLSSLT